MTEKILQQIMDRIEIMSTEMATKDDINRLENKIDRNTEQIDRNFNQIANNTEQLASLSDSSKRQEDTLATLALRSIEQESKLRKSQFK